MPTLDELLDAYIEDAGDEDLYYTIDADLRSINIPSGGDTIGVYHDVNVNIIPFKAPRYYKGLDMSTTTIYINYVNSNAIEDKYQVTDITAEDDYITFNWITGQNVFVQEGSVKFNVCMRLYESDNRTVIKEFNTVPTIVNVLEGLEVDSAAPIEQYSDIFNQKFTQWDGEVKESIQQIPDTVDEFWDGTFRAEAESDSQTYINSKMQVIAKEDYDKLTEYEAGKVYLVTYGE